MRKSYNFKKRIPELLKLEGGYYSLGLQHQFTISCRHKDILNAGNTRHFTSCYRKHGIYAHVPYGLCTEDNVAILGQKDRSGQYLWRAFIAYRKNYGASLHDIIVYKVYGNPPKDFVYLIRLELQQELGDKFPIYFLDTDCIPADQF